MIWDRQRRGLPTLAYIGHGSETGAREPNKLHSAKKARARAHFRRNNYARD
jgi:hypothetical protein